MCGMKMDHKKKPKKAAMAHDSMGTPASGSIERTFVQQHERPRPLMRKAPPFDRGRRFFLFGHFENFARRRQMPPYQV